MLNELSLYIGIGVIYLNFVFVNENLNYSSWHNPCDNDYSYQYEHHQRKVLFIIEIE